MIPSRSADYDKMFQVHHKLHRHLCVYSTSRDKRNLQTTKLTIQLSILISWDSHIYSPLTGTSLPVYEQNRRTTPLHPSHHIFHMHHSVYPISLYNPMARTLFYGKSRIWHSNVTSVLLLPGVSAVVNITLKRWSASVDLNLFCSRVVMEVLLSECRFADLQYWQRQ